MELCASLRNRLLEEGTSFGFETVASREDKLEFVRKAKEKRYYIDFIFVTAGTFEKCYERIQKRVGLDGHDVPKDKVCKIREDDEYHMGFSSIVGPCRMFGIIRGMGSF